MKKPEIPFTELAHRSLQDCAMRVLQNPNASPENLAAAKAALRAPHAPSAGGIDFSSWTAPAVLLFREALRALGTTTPHTDAELARRAVSATNDDATDTDAA